MSPIRTLCGWCGLLLSYGALVDGRASTGICAPCRAAHFPPRGAIPANPTPQLPPAECSDRRASSEGPATSSEVSA